MINETVDTVNKLQTALLLAEVFVSGLPRNTPFQKFEQRYLSTLEKNYIKFNLQSQIVPKCKFILLYEDDQATEMHL